MAATINNDYSRFYKGTEHLENYGSNDALKKDTLVRYEFNTTDGDGNKVMDKMSREETLRAMKEISAMYGDNVIVQFSGDGMAALVESKKSAADRWSDEDAAAREARNAAFQNEIKHYDAPIAEITDNLKTTDPLDVMRKMDSAAYEEYQRISRESSDADRPINTMRYLLKWYVDSVEKNPNMLHEYEQKVEKEAAESAKITSGSTTAAEAKLSERAQTLLKKLRARYGNIDFLVSSKGDNARNMLAGSTKEYSVLFTMEELEKMASDETYEKEYLDRMQNAIRMSEQIDQKFGFGQNGDGARISNIGISINEDGTTSFFAELEKVGKEQRERIEHAREERRVEKKEQEKKAEREKHKERTTVQADSIEELIEKIRQII